MTKSHPKYITTAALRFLNDVNTPSQRIYGSDENGKLYMSNGNAIYVGKPIDGLPPEYRADCMELLQPFIDKLEQQIVFDVIDTLEQQIVFDGCDLFVDEIRESKKQQKAAGVMWPVWRQTLPDGSKIGFLCDRLLRAAELLGKKNVTITLPMSPLQPAKLESQRGVIYQLPVRV